MHHDGRRPDILEVIDYLHAQVTDAKRPFMSNRVSIDEAEFIATIEQLRAAVPIEIQQARRIIQDRQTIILNAQAEAEKIIATARDRAEYLISEKGLTAEARYRGEDYLRQGRDTYKKLTGEVDSYAKSVFDEVERVMRENLTQIERAKMSIIKQH